MATKAPVKAATAAKPASKPVAKAAVKPAAKPAKNSAAACVPAGSPWARRQFICTLSSMTWRFGISKRGAHHEGGGNVHKALYRLYRVERDNEETHCMEHPISE